MADKIRRRAGFPARMQRWCTRELKIEPLRAYHDRVELETGRETVCVMGIRADESDARAKLAVFEDEPAGRRQWGGWLWRPILSWSAEESYAIHHRHGVSINPLYKSGHDRVGCYPCIYARKEEIRLVAEYAPGRIDEIRELEAETTSLRAARNEEEPGRYKYTAGTYFQSRTSDDGTVPIDEVVAWSRTERGGRQLPLLAPVPEGGCMQYGLCEAPAPEPRELSASLREPAQ